MILSPKNTVELSGLITADEPVSKLGRRFLATASLTAMAVMMSTATYAQAVPADCTPSPATAGATVTCDGTITNPISTTVDDLTLIITDDTTVTVSSGAAVNVRGGGNLTVTAAENSNLSGDNGLTVANYSGDDITVTAGDVTGVNTSEFDIDYGGGETYSSTRSSGRGITATSGGESDGDVSVTSTGTVTGGDRGIYVRNSGAGATTITAVDSVGNGSYSYMRTYGGESGRDPYVREGVRGTGIDARSGNGDLTIISTGTASGGSTGIRARANGDSDIIITAADSAGTNNYGISASLYGSSTYVGGDGFVYTPASGDIVITSTGAATGGQRGISVNNNGTGATIITAADVTATNEAYSGLVLRGGGQAGLDVYGGESSGDVTLTTTGTVTGGSAAINVRNYGQGMTTVNAVDTIATSDYGTAINVVHGGEFGGEYGGEYVGSIFRVVAKDDVALQNTTNPAAHNVSVTSTGTAMGGYTGISVINNGTGTTTVTAEDTIGVLTRETDRDYGGGATYSSTRTSGTGIRVYGGQDSGDLSVTSTGTATGGEYGINVINEGTGNTTITAVDSVGNGSFSTVRTYASIGGEDPVDPSMNEFVFGAGIYARNSRYSGDLDIISTGSAEGGEYGIRASAYGDSDITITAVDATATSNYSSGIHASNRGVYTYLGGGEGSVYTPASGDIVITSTGTVTGGETGIYVGNSGTGTVTVEAVDSTALSMEETNRDYGYGATYSSTQTRGVGIDVDTNSNSNSGDVSVTSAGTATGGEYGIHVNNYGTGNTTITAVDSAGNGSLSRVRTYGSSGGEDPRDPSVSEFAFGAGIFARNGTNSGDLDIISTGAAEGGRYGIRASAYGDSDITIDAVDATATSNDSYGIHASNRIVSTYLGGGEGFEITPASGDITITSTGTVTGGDSGIYVENNGTGTVTVEAVDSTALTTVERNRDYGYGASFSSTQTSGVGISVNTDNYSGDVSVTSTGTATGGEYGIYVNNYGPGSTTITAVDSIGIGSYSSLRTYGSIGGEAPRDPRVRERTFGAGISARSDGTAGDLNIISTGTAEGGEYGIRASAGGVSDITIAAVDATATSNYGSGIQASNRDTSTYLGGGEGFEYTPASGDITITSTGTVTGGENGIYARNRGTGATTINAENVYATGTRTLNNYGGEGTLVGRTINTGVAVEAYGTQESGDISISTTGAVNGSATAILARNYGDAATTIDVSGWVTGGDQGIVSNSISGTTITLAEGGAITGSRSAIDTVSLFESVSGEDPVDPGPNDGAADVLDLAGLVNGAVLTNDGTDTVTLASTGSINGTVFLGDGDDVFNAEGGNFAELDGGANADIFNANAGGLTLASSGTSNVVTMIETFNLNNGITSFAGTHSGIDAVNVASAGGLDLASGASVSGTVTNEGTLDIAQGAVGAASLAGDFIQTATGSATFDRTSETEADLLTVDGDVALGGTLNLNQSDVFLETITIIDGEDGLSGDFDQINGLTEGLFITQDVEIDVANADVNLVTSVVETIDPTVMAAFSPNQGNVINNLVDGLRGDNLAPELDELVRKLGVLSSAEDAARVAEELSPEFAGVGLQTVQNTQMLFMDRLLDQGGDSQGSAGVTQTASLFPSAVGKHNEGPTLWLNTGLVNVEQDGSADTIDFDADGYELALGITNIEAGAFSIGLSAGYSELDIDTSEDAFNGDGADEVETELLQFGIHTRFDIGEFSSGIKARVDAGLTYADGEHEFTQNINAAPIDTAITQTGETDLSHLGAALRVTLDGFERDAWSVEPHVKIGLDNYKQDAFTIGTGVTQQNVSGINNERYSVGYGADIKHVFEDAIYARLGASGTHHFGDTEGTLISSFTGAAGSSFGTVGSDVKNQYVIDGGLGNTFGSWTVEVSGYTQFGDLEGIGGNLNLSSKF